MIIYLLKSLAVVLLYFSPLFNLSLNAQLIDSNLYTEKPYVNISPYEIKKILQKEGQGLNKLIIDKVVTTIQCANQYEVDRNNILTVIDYSAPSNKKRLWVFDLNKKKLLFNTYVSHGITSGTLLTEKFSNKKDTKASSIGVYKTMESYNGREGVSLRLEGLDANFNDNALKRYIVMHGGWYMDEGFIKRYGRPGRSWGCPSLPLPIKKKLINTIKDNSLLVIYYPSDEWFSKSKFLNCSNVQKDLKLNAGRQVKPVILVENDTRENILYVDLKVNNTRDKDDPIITMSADNYEKIFNIRAPLSRMLRRQINKKEYIALSNKEFQKLALLENKKKLNKIDFVIPVIVKKRGRYRTQMKILNMGHIQKIHNNTDLSKQATHDSGFIKNYIINFDKGEDLHLQTTNEFIRWIGL